MQRTIRSSSSKADVWPTASLCEVLRIAPEPSKDGKPADRAGTIVVLPGNPGVPGYYRRFAEGLASSMAAEVVILGFCGHTLEPRVAPWKVYSLEDQVEHVVGFIDHVHGDGDGELRIVGHSIGAFIAFEAMRRRPRVVSHVLGLLPFFENNDGNPSFARMARLAFLPAPVFWPALGTLCLALAVVKVLPFGIRRMLARWQTGGFDPEWVDFTANAMLQPGVFANYAYMGRTELYHHARRFDFAAQFGSQGFAKRLRLLYTDGDFWAPEAHAAVAQAAGVRAELHEGLPHAFSVRAASCDWAADWSARQLRELADGPV